MQHPKDVGDRSTLAIIFALRLRGFTVYVPFGENTRPDLITDDGSRLARIQCKTGRFRNGGVRFATCSSYAHHPHPKVIRRTYDGEIDQFAVYCPELATVYLIPIEEIPLRKEAALRVLPTRNSQRKGIRWAAPYEIAKIDVV